MILKKDKQATIVVPENEDPVNLIELIEKAIDKLQEDNIVINLLSYNELQIEELLPFMTISDTHRSKKSFVLVTSKLQYDEIPEELCVVPTLQEAMDIIEMEEIERDLDF
jgi:hypothetical protein